VFYIIPLSAFPYHRQVKLHLSSISNLTTICCKTPQYARFLEGSNMGLIYDRRRMVAV